jgi:hypothetical protein
MKFFRLLLPAVAIILFVGAVAFAQQCTYPVGPNKGYATTPYTGSHFAVTFNDSVSVTTTRTDSHSETTYDSFNHGVLETITVRTIDHDIPADNSSLEFYLGGFCDGKEGCKRDTSVNQQGNWCGHSYSYGYYEMPISGTPYHHRERAIIVDSRTVLFIGQTAPDGYEDRDEWMDFEYSLRIN